MTWKERLIGIPLAAIGAVLLLATGAAVTLTHTAWGKEQLRGFLLEKLNGAIRGRVEIDAVLEGDLLRMVRMAGVRIYEPDGSIFADIDTLAVRYRWSDFLLGNINIARVSLVGPVVNLSNVPGIGWNFEEVFAGRGSTSGDSESEGPPGRRRRIVLRDVSIRSGDVSIRTPWEPANGADPDSSRWFLERVGEGWERVFRFERVSASLATARVEAPEEEGRLFQISQFSTRASIVGEAFEVEQLRADVTARRDTLLFHVWEGVFPDSRIPIGEGWVTLESDPQYDFTLRGDPITTDDIVWLLPWLPRGVANLDFSFSRRHDGYTLEAQNARWVSPGARLSGRFAMSSRDRPDGLRFEDADVSVEHLTTAFIDSVSGWASPVSASLAGHVAVDGPLSELSVDADLRIEPDTLMASSHVVAVGTVHARKDGLGARDLTLEADTLQLDLLRAFVPDLAVRGKLVGGARLNGRLADGMVFAFDVEQSDRALVPTHLTGNGTITADTIAPPSLDVELFGDPVSLTTLAEYYPAIPFRGTFRGRIQAVGPLDDLDVMAHLGGAAGDSLDLNGNVRLLSEPPRFRGELRGWRIATPEFRRNLPISDVDFKAEFEAMGSGVADLTGSGRLILYPSFVGGVGFDSADAMLGIADGRLLVDSSVVVGDFGELRASGALSLVAEVSDSIQFELRADSLGALNPWFFPALESMVGPSLTSEGPEEQGEAPGGRVEGVALISGWVIRDAGDFTLRGSGDGQRLSYGDLLADSFHVSRLEVGESGGAFRAEGEVWARGIGWGGVHFDELSLSGEHTGNRTAFEFDFDKRAAKAEGRVTIEHRDATRVIGLDALTVQFGTKTWTLAHPSEMRFASSGDWTVDDLVITSSAGGIEMDGTVVGLGPQAARAEVSGLNLSNVVRLWSDSIDVAGTATAQAELSGSASNPILRGSFQVADGRLVGVDFSDFRGDIDYRSGAATLDIAMWNAESRMFRVHGTFPVDLAVPGLSLSLADRTMELTVEGDSVPLTLANLITDQVANPRGRARGTVYVGGTPQALDLQGPVVVDGGSFRIVRSGIPYEGFEGQLRFHENVLDLTDVKFRGAAGGRGTATGSITFTSLTNPEFDIRLQARELPVYDQLDAFAVVSGTVNLEGRYDAPIVDGRLSVINGIFYVEEVQRQREIVNLFEDRFALIDTLLTLEGSARPGQNPFIKNMTMDLGLSIERETWLRSTEMNVEIAGDLTVQMRPGQEEWRIDGTLQAGRGDYRLFNKRFEVVGGPIEFVGDMNPNLRIVALYTVQTQKEPIDIRLIVGGTLEEMTLELESDHQPPISQSDLLSYLLFGRPSYELTRTGQERNLIEDVTAGVPQALVGYALSSLLVGEAGIAYVDVSRVTPAGAEGEYRSGVGPALSATQVEVGWYLAPTVFVSVAQHLVGAVRPTVRLDWRLDDNLTLRGITEPRFGREGVLYYGGPDPNLEQSIGVFLFYGWGY